MKKIILSALLASALAAETFTLLTGVIVMNDGEAHPVSVATNKGLCIMIASASFKTKGVVLISGESKGCKQTFNFTKEVEASILQNKNSGELTNQLKAGYEFNYEIASK